MTNWKACKKILVIRLDNMGDLLMSVPAINALKETFHCSISLLTSSAAEDITPMINSIDETIVYDVPWMKERPNASADDAFNIIELIRAKQFDGAVVFTVYSQNPMPAIMLAYLSQIPLRLAYCRENPYELLTHWVPDEEPYSFVRHQVTRDLDLVRYVDAVASDDKISLAFPSHAWGTAQQKLIHAGVLMEKPWLVFHPGVSESKRRYASSKWTEAAMLVRDELNYQIILTGTSNDMPTTESIKRDAGNDVFSLAGQLSLDEFAIIIRNAPLVVSVNTVTAHIAAAAQTKIVVLYAMTNPQHTPWKVPCKVLPFGVPRNLRSKNEVIRYVNEKYFPRRIHEPSARDVLESVRNLFNDSDTGQNIHAMMDFTLFEKTKDQHDQTLASIK